MDAMARLSDCPNYSKARKLNWLHPQQLHPLDHQKTRFYVVWQSRYTRIQGGLAQIGKHLRTRKPGLGIQSSRCAHKGRPAYQIKFSNFGSSPSQLRVPGPQCQFCARQQHCSTFFVTVLFGLSKDCNKSYVRSDPIPTYREVQNAANLLTSGITLKQTLLE